jgi:uncharacterized membrane protein
VALRLFAAEAPAAEGAGVIGLKKLQSETHTDKLKKKYQQQAARRGGSWRFIVTHLSILC